MNKKTDRMLKLVKTDTTRAQLIERLEKLKEQLDDPQLTKDKFEDIKGKVLAIQNSLSKISL